MAAEVGEREERREAEEGEEITQQALHFQRLCEPIEDQHNSPQIHRVC